MHVRLGIGRGAIRVPEESLEAYLSGATVQLDEPATPTPPPTKLKHLKV
jgi:hypothetical protein